MTYNLIAPGQEFPARLAPILAEVFGVSLADVDVSEESDFDSRNWDAEVTCEYSAVRGDLNWSVSIYATDAVQSPPSEEALALKVAQALGVPVLFPGTVAIPNVWRIATPQGGLTHARVTEPESESERLTIDAVEDAIPEFPRATVTKFREIIKELQLPSKVTDSHLPEGISEGRREVRSLLVNWERLTVRMATGWPPSAWYPASMYVEDLELRDQTADVIGRLPADERHSATEALEQIDQAYRGLTVEDGGENLAKAADVPIVDRAWYWYRRPQNPPWDTPSK
ncbi:MULTISPECIES: hypothetical protein [unclassified Streptomyces]|uniref:hypothetical protein n=1 Tax=unclassified Streptomyces TaxID=2593676 RepID=UPI000477600E|nr:MULTISPECIES: hypothetical protein [unclassified Streptomyces]MYT31779.1 hypothetical protein [Streptomyces sp. SID8354]